MAVEIWLTEPYYKDFHKRKDSLFDDLEAVDVYVLTQLLQANWPQCLQNPTVLPEVGTKSGIHYVKLDWPTCRLRIAFGARQERGIHKVVALSCRTKQELSKGRSNGTQEWYKHMATHALGVWDDYRRGIVHSWKIY
ncbi:MAG: hypothetical protein H7318_05480 [Oligoflexus sp.]|nr:hypothetical protein [Oligoflexus sp.]